jgi:hypothetical protein
LCHRSRLVPLPRLTVASVASLVSLVVCFRLRRTALTIDEESPLHGQAAARVGSVLHPSPSPLLASPPRGNLSRGWIGHRMLGEQGVQGAGSRGRGGSRGNSTSETLTLDSPIYLNLQRRCPPSALSGLDTTPQQPAAWLPCLSSSTDPLLPILAVRESSG